MGELIMPDGGRIDVSAPTPYEQQSLALLQAIMRLLDMLVALECGALKRADLKADILANKAAQQQAVPTAEASLDAAIQAGD